MPTPTGIIGLAAAGVHQDSSGVWYGPGAFMPGGTPFVESATGTAGNATTLTIAGAAGAYALINHLIVSGAGLPVSLVSAQLSITGPFQNFVKNVWTGPALGLEYDADFGLWGIIAGNVNTALVITVAAITGVTVSITAVGLYI